MLLMEVIEDASRLHTYESSLCREIRQEIGKKYKKFSSGSLYNVQEMHNEIQDVLGQSFAVPDGLDEDDLLEELDALEDEMANELESGNRAGVPSYLQVDSLQRLIAFSRSCCLSAKQRAQAASFFMRTVLTSDRSLSLPL